MKENQNRVANFILKTYWDGKVRLQIRQFIKMKIQWSNHKQMLSKIDRV